MMGIHIAAATRQGVKSTVNQDAVYAKSWLVAGQQIGLIAVADGLGGHDAGEMASTLAIQGLAKWANDFMVYRPEVTMHLLDIELDQVFEDIHGRILEYNLKNALESGTTLTVCVCVGRQFILKNIGDTRGYFFDGDILQQCSIDDTWVAEQVARKLLSHEEACSHEQRNVLLRCLGLGDFLSPHTLEGNIAENQAVLICSDGFYAKLSGEEIQESVLQWMQDNVNPLAQMHSSFMAREVADDISIALMGY